MIRTRVVRDQEDNLGIVYWGLRLVGTGARGGGKGVGWLKTVYLRTVGDRVRRMVHMGIGYDVHRLVDGRKLVLGGVTIPHEKGLEGHSDADVLMHAVCDAILGALGDGDIGHLFPNTDPRWKNASSAVFLQEAARRVNFHDGRLVNVDVTVIAERPKIGPHVHAMRTHVSEALGIHPRQVGIKATTNEGLGFLGREEGIAAMAIAGVELPR
jgi:2-C-methyl-D-erythritol 2,4-cyclodiphosphate synthase